MDKSEKRQRIVTRRYTPSVRTIAWNERKVHQMYIDDSDTDFESQASSLRNLKISNYLFYSIIIVFYIIYMYVHLCVCLYV